MTAVCPTKEAKGGGFRGEVSLSWCCLDLSVQLGVSLRPKLGEMLPLSMPTSLRRPVLFLHWFPA